MNLGLAASVNELILDALGNLYAQRQRSALALLGIVIGTASVVAMLTIGHMAEREALKLFAHMGLDKLVVQASDNGSTSVGLNRTAVDALFRHLPDVERAAALTVGHVDLQVGGVQQGVGVAAATPDLQSLAGLQVAQGRFIGGVDVQSLVAVIGAGAAAKLSTPGAAIGLGSRVRLGTYLFTVIGVLKSAQATAFDPTDFNDAVIVPLETRGRALGQEKITSAVVQLRPGADASLAAAAVQAEMQRASPKAQIQVQSARQLIQTLKAQKAVHTRLLAAIGGISLVVGGIGVMNVMLMNVLERRREIGLRAAIGASPRDIQFMFLIEAAALSLIGGLVGDLAGLTVAYISAVSSGWTFSPAYYALLLGAGVAMLVGMTFGLYPAVKASTVDPIEALRAA